MQSRIPSIALTLAALAFVGALLSAQAPGRPPTRNAVVFATDIQPILEKNCLSCHGDAMQMGKFDLRTREMRASGGFHVGPATGPSICSATTRTSL